MKFDKIYNRIMLEHSSLLTEGTDIIPIQAGHVLLADYVKNHIQTHNQIGIGSVFSPGVDINQIIKVIQELDISGDGGLYTTSYPGVGYNLVLPIEKAKTLPGAQITEVNKDERGQNIPVPAVKTTAPLEQFKTDQLTVIVRPSNPDYLPDDAKTDEVMSAVQQGQSFSVLTAFPGDPNVPPASQWNGQFAVILPST
jgi:hypothetical protein